MADGLLTREEREAIRGEAERSAKRIIADEYVTKSGCACDGDWLGRKAVPTLLDHAEAADKLLREARDVLQSWMAAHADLRLDPPSWETQDFIAKLTQALGEEAKSGRG